jgi:hypothetical protein
LQYKIAYPWFAIIQKTTRSPQDIHGDSSGDEGKVEMLAEVAPNYSVSQTAINHVSSALSTARQILPKKH